MVALYISSTYNDRHVCYEDFVYKFTITSNFISSYERQRGSGGVQQLSEYRRSLNGETTESCRAIIVFRAMLNELLQDRRTVIFMKGASGFIFT